MPNSEFRAILGIIIPHSESEIGDENKNNTKLETASNDSFYFFVPMCARYCLLFLRKQDIRIYRA